MKLIKALSTIMAGLGFLWVGFWLRIDDPKMLQQLQDAMNDGFSKYPPK